MKEEGFIRQQGTFHWIYIYLMKIVDLSEFIYNKLNYIKSNYKDILINLFEEEDYSTQSRSKEDYSENKYIKPIINWLSSLFGLIEEEDEVLSIANQANVGVFSKAINFPFKQTKTNLSQSILVIFNVLFFHVINYLDIYQG